MKKVSLVSCPKCKHPFEITDALKFDVEQKIRTRLESEFDKKLEVERGKLAELARGKVKQEFAEEVEELRESLRDRDAKLKNARTKELSLRKKQQELLEKEENLQLEVQRTLDAERTKIATDIRTRVTNETQLKLVEKDRLLETLRQEINQLKQRSESQNQKLIGDAQEIEVLRVLSEEFKADQFERVGNGKSGADIIQRVKSASGYAGCILYEVKRTRHWSNVWIEKVRKDQRDARVQLAVLVSQVLPEQVTYFGFHEGIWVAQPEYAVALASVLRSQLLEVERIRSLSKDRDSCADSLMQYIGSPLFRQRVEAVLSTFVLMKSDLDSEMRAIQRIWSKREKHLGTVITETSRMYGDLQAIQTNLPDIEILKLEAGVPI